jgi:hypothetical protein
MAWVTEATPATAQDLNHSSQNEYQLSGTVVNSVTGEPVRRALVDAHDQQVLTDAEGKFEVGPFPKGEFSISVRKPGFFSESEATNEPHRLVMARIGPDITPLTVKLVPEAVISGRVEVDGEPAEDLPVHAMAQRIHDGRKVWVQQGGGNTNADGAFRIANLLPGTYYVSVGPHWTRPEFGSSRYEKGFAEVFYDSAEDLETATPIILSAGQRSEVDLSIKSPRLFHISGTVSVPTGMRANLEMLNRAGVASTLPTNYNPAGGEFQTAAPPGNYMLQAQTYSSGNPPMTATVPLDVHSDISGIHLVLMPAITIPVYVRKENVAPEQMKENSGTYVFSGITDGRTGKQYSIVSHDGSMVSVSLQSKDTFSQRGNFNSSYRMIGDIPQLEIANVDAGRYSVSFDIAGGNWYVRSAQCGSVDLLREDLVISPGVQPPPIEVVVRNDSARITGKVAGDMPSAVYTLLLVPDDAPFRARRMMVFPQGQFNFVVAPGDYSVLALDHAGNLEYTNPEVLSPYLVRAQHISVHANEKVEVNPDLVKVER